MDAEAVELRDHVLEVLSVLRVHGEREELVREGARVGDEAGEGADVPEAVGHGHLRRRAVEAMSVRAVREGRRRAAEAAARGLSQRRSRREARGGRRGGGRRASVTTVRVGVRGDGGGGRATCRRGG